MDYARIHDMGIALFSGISAENLKDLFGCLDARTASYARGDTVWLEGDPLRRFGVVLEGNVNVYRDDILGNRTLMTVVTPPELFGETIVCAGLPESPVTVESGADTRVLFLSFERAIRPCTASCTFHNALIRNMLGILARKNLTLSDKIGCISKKTTRQKLAAYLIGEATRQRSRAFSVPLDRQALADYLGVNRSALSRELSAICAQGALSCSRNRFEIRDPEMLEGILLSE